MKIPVESRGRALRRIAWLALAAYVLYLVAGNLFINTGLGHATVNRKPEKFRMEWSGGHTLWPGRVSLRAVRMHGHVRKQLWSVEADAVRGRIALLPLLRRQVRMPWIEADGVTGSVAQADTEMPRPEPRPGGWMLRMDRITSDSLRGGNVRDWKIEGDGRAEVGFVKQLRGGPMELLSSSVVFEAASLRKGGIEWLRDAHVASTFSLPSHVSSEYPGLAKLDLLATTLEMQGTTVRLRSKLDDEGRYDFAALPGDGRLDAKLALDRGVLAAGDHLRLRVPLEDVDAQGTSIEQAMELRFEVDDALNLHVVVPERENARLFLDADLALPGTTLPIRDFRERLVTATGRVQARGYLPSIGGVVALFSRADWIALEGSGIVDADLGLREGRLTEGSRLRATDVQARADLLGNRFSGNANAEAKIGVDAKGDPQSRLDVVMQSFSAASGASPGTPWLSGNGLTLEAVSDARFEHMLDSMRARVRFERARIPELSRLNAYLPNDNLRFGGGSGTLAGDLRIDGHGEVGQGTLRVDGRQVRMHVAGMELGGDLSLNGQLRRGNLQAGEFELDNTTASVRNVVFTDADGNAHSGWWATLDIGHGRVAWKQPSTAGGDLGVRMRDIGFLMAMFADRTAFPGWVGKVVDAGEAHLTGKWLWEGKRLVLDQARAENDRFKVHARLALEGPRKRGDLHLQWGVLGAAVELHDDERKFHLRKAREWYDGRPDLLR